MGGNRAPRAPRPCAYRDALEQPPARRCPGESLPPRLGHGPQIDQPLLHRVRPTMSKHIMIWPGKIEGKALRRGE